MKAAVRSIVRDARYALPGLVERKIPGPGPEAAVRVCERLHKAGLHAAVGYFQRGNSSREEIVEAYTKLARLLNCRPVDCYLSVKAPPLSFDGAALERIAGAARLAGLAMMFDAHGPAHADPTLDAVARFLPDFPATGCVLPARWLRSLGDAERFRDTTARIRVVKGEWADPGQSDPDFDSAFLALVASLAGRSAPVAVATHKPDLARQALRVLLDAGTPCELEQLRGLPRKRTTAIARGLGVPVRVYVPFGPGWLPYALDKALARPHLPRWFVRDFAGRPDPGGTSGEDKAKAPPGMVPDGA